MAIDLVNVAAGIGGFVIYGADAGDGSGFSVSSAGDVNGDGFDDLIIGARYADGPGGAGHAQFCRRQLCGVRQRNGLSGGDRSRQRRRAASAASSSTGRMRSDQSGISVSSAGDVNGDGFDDLIIGAHGADGPGGTDAAMPATAMWCSARPAAFGAAIDLAHHRRRRHRRLRDLRGEMRTIGPAVRSSSAGDVNGDGFDDLIVGAPYADGPGAPGTRSYAGDSYVVFGQAAGFPAAIDLATVAAGTGGFVIHGADADDYSGTSVASAGDVNGDGFDDLIVGAPGADGPGRAGYAQRCRRQLCGVRQGGRAFGAAIDLADMSPRGTGGFVIHGRDANDQVGLFGLLRRGRERRRLRRPDRRGAGADGPGGAGRSALPATAMWCSARRAGSARRSISLDVAARHRRLRDPRRECGRSSGVSVVLRGGRERRRLRRPDRRGAFRADGPGDGYPQCMPATAMWCSASGAGFAAAIDLAQRRRTASAAS